MNRRSPLVLAAFVAFLSATVGMAVAWVEQAQWIQNVNAYLGLKSMGIDDLNTMIPPIFATALLCAGVGLVVYLAAIAPRMTRLPRGVFFPAAAVLVWLAVCAVGQSLGWASSPWPGWFEVATTDYGGPEFGLWEMATVLLAALIGTGFALAYQHMGRSTPARPRGSARERGTSRPRGAVRPPRSGRPAARTPSPQAGAAHARWLPWVALAVAAVCLAAATLLGLPLPYIVMAAMWSLAAWLVRGQSVGTVVALAISGALVQCGLLINSPDAVGALPQALLATLAPVPLCAWTLLGHRRA